MATQASKKTAGKVVVFAADYHRNGEVLYPAGVPVPHTEHTAQLLDEGVEGQISDAPAEAAQA